MNQLAAFNLLTSFCWYAADVALKQRQKKFQEDVERVRHCLQKLTVQPDGIGRRVALLQRTIGEQNAREKRGARAEAAAKAAAKAAAHEQEELYGGVNVEVDGLQAAHGNQLQCASGAALQCASGAAGAAGINSSSETS